jgi:hypothetical protein
MKLFLINRVRGETDPIYDCYDQHLIRAEDEESARRQIVDAGYRGVGDEGYEVWLHETTSKCFEITVDGPPAIIISSFHAG